MDLKVTVEKQAKNSVMLDITVSATDLELGLTQAAKEMSKKVNIPGFRKGKAPRMILENYLGEGALLEEAVESVLPDAYAQAVDENNIWPVDTPKVELIDAKVGEGFHFKAVVDVKPEVVLGQYKGVEIYNEVVIPSEEDVLADLESSRNRLAKIEDVADGVTAENGDTVVIDYAGSVDDVAFEGGTAEQYSLQLGSGSFIPGFEDQLVGAAVGADIDVKVTFPAEYHAEDLAGKDAIFKVKVHAIRRKVLPEIDDAFAQELDEECDNLEQLKAKVLKDLTERNQQQAVEAGKNDGIEKVIENCNLELPNSMVEHRIDDLVKDFEQQLQYQGLNLETYMQYTGSDIAAFREMSRSRAESMIKCDLILEAIVQEEKIMPTDEEIDEYLGKMAASYNQPLEAVKEMMMRDPQSQGYIIMNLSMQKAIDFIFDNAVILDGPAPVPADSIEAEVVAEAVTPAE